jgi:tetratricopeptide (TPR) repeat protein
MASLAPTERARLLALRGKLAYHRSDWATAAASCEQALAELAAGPSTDFDTTSAAIARCYLGGAYVVTGRAAEGAELAEAARSAAVALADYQLQVVAVSVLAIAAAVTGDFAAERRRYEERLRLVRAHGDRARIADTLNTLAEIALDENDAQGARNFAEQSLATSGDRLPLERRDALITVARADAAQGDARAAALRLRAALRLSERTGQALGTAQCWRVMACLLAASEPAVAVRLFAAAQVLHPSPSGTDEPAEADFARGLQQAHAELGGVRAGQEWAIGSALPPASVAELIEGYLASFEGIDQVATG